jgi:HEAT repeat protein
LSERRVLDAAGLIPYLYTYNASPASQQLVALGAVAVDSLIAVMSGAQPVPDLMPLEASEESRALLGCLGVPPTPNCAAARERAAYLLGDIGDLRAVEPLIAAFAGESDRFMRMAIVRALGKIGDPRAIEPLITALAAPAWTPDFGILVDDLARIGGARAVEPLIGVVQSKTYSYGCAAHAARILSSRHDDPRVLDGLIGGLRLDAEFSTLQTVIDILGEWGDPRGAQALVSFVRELIALPPERWDDRFDNLSETDEGVTFHILKTELNAAIKAIRRIGDGETVDALKRALNESPVYIPRN